MASEDTLIILAIDKDHTSIPAITSALKEFFETKAAMDRTDRFNMVLFLERGPVYVDDFTFQHDFLLNLLVQYGNEIGKPNFEGGFFLGLTFILDIYKVVGGKFFRILVIKDGSVPPITKDFLLNNLINHVKPMPAFLDIISLGTDSDPDTEKLLDMIGYSQGGALYHARTIDQLGSVLREMATTKKEIEVGTWDSKADVARKMLMDPEHKPFFEDLASDLDPVDHITPEMKCTVCFQASSPVCQTDALVICPSCTTPYHDCCLVSWSEQSNIGVDHVFRCPICFYLIKLPEFLVQDILNGNMDDYAGFTSCLEEIDQDQLLIEKDAQRELNLILKELEF